ncbi:MAG: hypothetical protein FJ271_25320 [Planctomycetes bacterium]|nr:hypothetical protein [Planctomycetota bacterium]
MDLSFPRQKRKAQAGRFSDPAPSGVFKTTVTSSNFLDCNNPTCAQMSGQLALAAGMLKFLDRWKDRQFKRRGRANDVPPQDACGNMTKKQHSRAGTHDNPCKK